MNGKDKEKIFSRACKRAGIKCSIKLYAGTLIQVGPYTCVEVVAYQGKPYIQSHAYGFSKCSPRDKFNPDIGLAIALSRAATDAAKKLAKELEK